MFRKRNRLTSLLMASLLGCFALSMKVDAAADPACKPVFDANARQKSVPTHIYLTAPEVGEQIYAANAIYILRKGTWKRSPMTPQQMVQQEEENIRDATSYTCRHLSDESINGEAAALYAAESTNAGVTFKGQVWISRTRGLPLKMEGDTTADGGAGIHMSARYEYGNVQAPAGVK
jgi:hypothetical protein